MHDWLLHLPIIRLFVIIALGYLVGEIRFPGNFRLGVAGVLFVGLACGAWGSSFELPSEVQTLGLVLFVYCIGLQAAPGFFKSFKQQGLALNAAVTFSLILPFLFCYLAIHWKWSSGYLITGVFCGALTNTPALGAVTETIVRNGGSANDVNLAVMGYGLSYPIAIVLVLIISQLILKRAPVLQINNPDDILSHLTIAVEKNNASDQPWRAVDIMSQVDVLLTRYRVPKGQTVLVTDQTVLLPGSLVVAVGNAKQLEALCELLGRVSLQNLQEETSNMDVQRYFVSNPIVVEKPIKDLRVARLGAVISRIQRGDVELSVHPETVLHLGDRVQLIVSKGKESEVRTLFGNSLVASTETGYFSFALGIILGLVIGQIPFPIPGLSGPIYLGMAGGPLAGC